MTSPAVSSPLAEYYAAESARIRAQFEASGAGLAALSDRSALVDQVVTRLYAELFSSDSGDLCVVALGGYGRSELFPHSDIDLLFLTRAGRPETAQRNAIATMARTLWDLRMRVAHSTRPLAECSQLHRDNLEFNISLLDSRYLAGDLKVFERLRNEAIPHFVARDRDDLVRNLADLTEQRHAKHSNTVFHLEPNIKEGPGGLRDFHVARWLTMIAEIDAHGRLSSPEEAWPPSLRSSGKLAFDFLAALRCFLHYRYERDDNLLTYEHQDGAARLSIGHDFSGALSPVDWMCTYFRHARVISQLTARSLDEIAPARSALYGLFQQWRTRLSSPDFTVTRERIYPKQSAASSDLTLLLNLFAMVGRHGLALSREAERWVEEVMARQNISKSAGLWPELRRILTLPHAIEALRAMHRLGVLTTLLPEFRAIDCLVVRDYFHRYTVDEHSLMTIQNLQELAAFKRDAAEDERRGTWLRKLADIISEVERTDLLYLSLLLHDIGKGMPVSDHIIGSLEAVESVSKRLKLDTEESETIRFLIANHLEMSATLQRRDIFDPETVKVFAEKMGTVERLKMLALFTFADVKSVSPEALTPWKTEMIWRLYASTSNHLVRSLDQERVEVVESKPPQAERVLGLLGASVRREDFNAFLEGFPKRYIETHSADDIAIHFAMARQLSDHPVQVTLRARERYHLLTVLTADRPRLFASITGTLAAWGMNILKADAFANRAGTVLDTFRFVDLHRTLELNPPEVDRFKASVLDVLTDNVSLATLLKGRMNQPAAARPKIRIPTHVLFDDESSSHSTLLELITQDRPGLLYQVSSALAETGSNIDVALIDTEGQKVIDVFYLTQHGAKLNARQQEITRDAILTRLESLALLPTDQPQ